MSTPYIELARGDEEVSTTVSPRQPLNQEFGVGTSMPFSVPYSGPQAGGKDLYEALRPLGEDQGPSVSQLEAMRRMDGQARALYRLITQPIRAALKGARIVTAEVAAAQITGADIKPLTGASLSPAEKAAAQAEGTAPPPGPAAPLAPGAPPAPPAPAAPPVPKVAAKVGLAAAGNPDSIDGQNVTETKGSGEDEAAFIQQMLFLPPNGGGMTVPIRRMLAQMLMGIFDGFAPFELVYQSPATGPLKGKWTLQKAAYRPAATITFLTDEAGSFAGLRQRTFFHGKTLDVKIDAENVMYYAANEEERPFYGVSYFQAAFYHYDKKCLTGDTKVSLLDGSEVEIAELARRSTAGEQLWVYSCQGGKVVPGLVSHVWPSGVKPTVAVRLDNDEIIKCTPDHRFMLRDGTFREAGSLQPGDSLMPLYRQTRKMVRTDYEQVQHPVDSRWQFTHSMVADVCLRPREYCEVVHHVDINPRNNVPENLMVLSRQAHIELHGSMMRERWQDPAWRAMMAAPERTAKLADSLRRSWAEATPERRAERAQIVRDNASASHRTEVTVEAIAEQVQAGARKRLDVALALHTNEVIVLQRVKAAGHASWRAFVSSVGAVPINAHDYGAGRPQRFTIQDLEDACEIAADETGYARLADVVRVLNCSMSQVYRTLQYHDLGTFSQWRDQQGNFRNHKVVSVEPGEAEEVYDLEVPGLENFALSAGVFVHNCKLYYISHLAAQRAATGTRVGTMPENASVVDKNAFQLALADLGVAQYITLPNEKWKVDVLKDGGTFDYMTYINHHNSQMSKSVLASFFDQSQGSGKGESTISSAPTSRSAGAMSDTFTAMLKAIMEDLAEVINNQLIPRFIDWNFGGSSDYPQFVWGTFTDEEEDAIAATFDKLATAGQTSNATPEFMRALEQHQATAMGLDIDYREVAKREVSEQAKAAAQQAMIATGGQPPGQAPAPGQAPPPPDPAAALAQAKASAPLSTSPVVGLSLEDEATLLSLASQLLEAAGHDSR